MLVFKSQKFCLYERKRVFISSCGFALSEDLRIDFDPHQFVICVVVAVPSLVLLAYLQRRKHFAGLETPRVVSN